MEQTVRLNKYIASTGLCSRREADRLIADGRVTVDGRRAEVGSAVSPGMIVAVDGETVTPRTETVVFAYYKPRGVVCTDRDEHAERTLSEELAGRPELEGLGHLLYIGRLDRESEGLLLLTNDGALKHRLESAESAIGKEYEVTTDQALRDEARRRLENGVFLEELGLTTRPCRILAGKDPDGKTFRIILTEGKNRQIRRMCESEGLRVLRLVRIREGGVTLGDMKPGELRLLQEEERRALEEPKTDGGSDQGQGIPKKGKKEMGGSHEHTGNRY